MFMLGLAVAGGITYKLGYFDNSVVAENATVETIIDQTPDWAKDEDAVKAAQDVLRKKELEARLEVLNLEIKERQAEAATIEKELGTY